MFIEILVQRDQREAADGVKGDEVSDAEELAPGFGEEENGRGEGDGQNKEPRDGNESNVGKREPKTGRLPASRAEVFAHGGADIAQPG